MCGICGQLGHSLDVGKLETVITHMTEKLTHRGPDDSGIWVDQDKGLGFGHRRLSILDLSSAGKQPMLSSCSRYVLCFNGEIYNHFELRQKLEFGESKISWRGHSDSETILECVRTWGLLKSLELFRGMFAFALWDRECNKLFLARDRVGEKPLYYGTISKTFLFGSELSALKLHPSFCANIDRTALRLLLKYNYIPAPYSIYKDIQKLPPGALLSIDWNENGALSKPKIDFYWSYQNSVDTQPYLSGHSELELVSKLNQLLHKSVREQMNSDVPVGALLSGGIDSSLITALMQENSSIPINTYSIGFEQKDYNEAHHAKTIAEQIGTNHHEFYITSSDALDIVPNVSSIWDEPFADASQIPTWIVMKMASADVTVALSGDGADELFGGYGRYLSAHYMWNMARIMPARIRNNLGRLLVGISPDRTKKFGEYIGVMRFSEKVRKAGEKFKFSDSLRNTYMTFLTEWQESHDIVLGELSEEKSWCSELGWLPLSTDTASFMARDLVTYLPDDILVKVDRAAMACSLETRAPFLDRRVVEFSAGLPLNMKVNGGSGKYLLKKVLDMYVPREIMNRPKMGFVVPLDVWLRGPLRDWAEELLNKSRIEQEGFFNSDLVGQVWNVHLSGKADYGHRLWSILMFQSWLERQDSEL